MFPVTNLCGHRPTTEGDIFGIEADDAPDIRNFNAFAWSVIAKVDLSKLAWKHFASGVIRAYPRSDVFIHVWDPALRTFHPEEQFHDIHDHQYTVVSTILKGSLVDARYDVLESREGVDLYEVKHDDRTLRSIGKAAVTETSRTRHKEGSVYVVPKKVWHKTVIDKPCITFVYPMDNDEHHPARQLGNSSPLIDEKTKQRAAARMRQILSSFHHVSIQSEGKSP